MILNCDSCGRPLGAADVVGETRRCVGCSGPVGPTRAALPDPTLAAARAAWTEQVHIHKTRLGLSFPQRAALTGALLGRRSLWTCTSAELYEQIALLAAMHSATEVTAFIARQRLEGETP